MHTLIEINRFMTMEEIRVAYNLPESLVGKILPALRVAAVQDNGTPLFLESQVDKFIAELVQAQRVAEARANPPAPGKQGRKNDTLEIAIYADELKRQNRTWKEIFKACKERWPNDARVRNAEQIRKTWDRLFGPRTRRSDCP
jgi:hypothetical protein